MVHVLENDFLRVEIADTGAELCRVFDKEKGWEVLWNADPAYWKRHAPVLFPQVGKNFGGHFLYQGKEYPTSQHGFARDSVFTVVEKTENSITHELTSTEETLKKYPFSFVFRVTQTLVERNLEVHWYVKNVGEHEMFFTIGGHPAFNVPVIPGTKQTDYTLQFKKDALTYLLIDMGSGTAIADVSYELKTNHGAVPIVEGMFDKDALIFDHQVDWVGIALPDGSPYVSLSCEDFPNLGVWASPGAPFICLEPWDGRCDNYGFVGEISTKDGILALKQDEIYEKSYVITVH